MARLRILLVSLIALLGSACAKEIVAHRQPEGEAIKVLNLLEEEGIEAEKVQDKESRELAFDVTVAKDDAKRAYSLLKKNNLPEKRKDGTSEMFKEGGMIPTSEQERAKREVGISGDIMNGLRRVPRVIEVSATVSMPEDNPLRDVNEAKPRPKASVIIAYIPDAKGLPPISVEQVQQFAQGALPELKASEVSVLLLPTEHMNGTGSGADKSALPIAANACERSGVIGINVCSESRQKLLNTMLGTFVVAGILAGMAVLAVLRALRYRKDLTRLTAQVQQLRK